jgi:hypothetical protein
LATVKRLLGGIHVRTELVRRRPQGATQGTQNESSCLWLF